MRVPLPPIGKGLGAGLGKAAPAIPKISQAAPGELAPRLPKPEISSIKPPELQKPNLVDVKTANNILNNAKAQGIESTIKNLAEEKFNEKVKPPMNQSFNRGPENIKPNIDKPKAPGEAGAGKPPEKPPTTFSDQTPEHNPLKDPDYLNMQEASIRYGTEEAAKVHQEIKSGNPTYNSSHLDTAMDFGRLKAQAEFINKFPEKANELSRHDPHLRRAIELKKMGAKEARNAALRKDVTTIDRFTEASKTSTEAREIIEGREATFGSFEVRENLNADLLSPKELETYQKGFETLQRLINSATPDQKKLLLTPQVSSSIVGLQPILGLNNVHEATAIYNSFERAGINFSENYSFYRFIDPSAGVEGYQPSYTLVNNPAAELTLRANSDILPLKENFIDLPSDGSLSQQELSEGITKLFNSDNPQVRHLTYGLMSGFPGEDVKSFIEIPEIKAQVRDRVLTQTYQYDKLQNYDSARIEFDLYKKAFLPDYRMDAGAKNFASGFGLTWRTNSFPASESTVNHAQKLLQIDRSLIQRDGTKGYLDYFEKQGITTKVTERMFTQSSSIPQAERELIYPTAKAEDMLPVVKLGLFGFTPIAVGADQITKDFIHLYSLLEKQKREEELTEEERKKLQALIKYLQEDQEKSNEEKTAEIVQVK